MSHENSIEARKDSSAQPDPLLETIRHEAFGDKAGIALHNDLQELSTSDRGSQQAMDRDAVALNNIFNAHELGQLGFPEFVIHAADKQ